MVDMEGGSGRTTPPTNYNGGKDNDDAEGDANLITMVPR